MSFSTSRTILALAAMPCAALLLSGCSGSAVGNTSTAHIRSVDAAVNAQTVDILINGGDTYGDQTFLNSDNNSPASPYQYIQPQNNISLSYFLTQLTLPSPAVPVTNTGNVMADNYYTAFLIGSFNASYATAPADPRILKTILLPPRAAATTNLATVRVLDAAPDAGFSQQTVGGTVSDTAGTINVTIGSPVAATFSNVGYGTVSPYATLSAGNNLPVTVTLTGSATGTVTTTTQNISVAAGQVYTLVLTETSSSPTPTYSLLLLPD